jgi:hypothetical protein
VERHQAIEVTFETGMRVAILFTDGVGIGRRDPTINPLARGEFLLSQFEGGVGSALPAGGQVHPVDTTFGVPVRPQSASNQTAIYSGTDAPRAVGAHVLGFPTTPLKKILEQQSIVRRLREAGRTASFVNTWPGEYLEALGLPHQPSAMPSGPIPPAIRRRMKPSASTLAFAAAGASFRTFDELKAGRGLTHDIDGAMAARRFPEVPRRSAAEAANIFWSLAEDFTLFEHFLADEAGHLQDEAAALAAIGTFDAFAREVIARRPTDTVVVICSDHGNVEDLSTRNHTTNPVAVLTFGLVEGRLETVADVGRIALDVLGVSG